MDPEHTTSAEQVFSVPIHRIEMPGCADRCDAILAAIDRVRAVDLGTSRSNQGGWRSSDLLHSEEPELRWVTSRIAALCEMFLRGSGDLGPDAALAMRTCWVLANEAGDWNMPHSHYGNDWSGVLHLRVPEMVGTYAGNVVFIDPLGRLHGHPTLTTIAPTLGNLLLFPASLVHMVAPHAAGSARVSLTFNCDAVEREVAQG